MRVVQMNPSSGTDKQSFNRTTSPPVPPSFRKSSIDPKAFKKDDWILIGIMLALILEGSEDYILLCALGYLFIMGL